MSRQQFFQAIFTSHNYCHRFLRWLLGVGLLLALRSLVGPFDMRVRYAPILLSSLWIGVIHKNECERFSQRAVLQISTAIVFCVRLCGQLYGVRGVTHWITSGSASHEESTFFGDWKEACLTDCFTSGPFHHNRAC